MKDLISQAEFLKSHRGSAIIVGTITGVKGSAYRRDGARKIFALDTGLTLGVLSGGCLEGEVDKEVLTMKDFPQCRTYDTRELEDRFFGFQKGCQGEITIRFDKVDWDSENILEKYLAYSENSQFPNIVENLNSQTEIITRPFKLFIFGARGGAVSLTEFAQSLGWRVKLCDYRTDLLEEFPKTSDVSLQPVKTKDIFSELILDEQSAVICMTHNYEFDLELLKQIQTQKFFYLGLVGSPQRFELLKADLKNIHQLDLASDKLEKIFSPAGEKLSRNSSPEVISLSMIYQIQKLLSSQ